MCAKSRSAQKEQGTAMPLMNRKALRSMRKEGRQGAPIRRKGVHQVSRQKKVHAKTVCLVQRRSVPLQGIGWENKRRRTRDGEGVLCARERSEEGSAGWGIWKRDVYALDLRRNTSTLASITTSILLQPITTSVLLTCASPEKQHQHNVQ